MKNVTDTIASQYANSPTITTLIEAMNQYIDPSIDIENFYNVVWNIETASGFGLDIWGRIVNVSRVLLITTPTLYLGFEEQAGAQPLNQAPFYNGPPATQSYTLSDDAYRKLILTKALTNISTVSASSLNAILRNLFADRGRAYIFDQGNMSMRFGFEFALEPFEIAMLSQSGAIARPAGVQASVVQFQADETFGFSEMGGVIQPFDQGVFLNYETAIIPVI